MKAKAAALAAFGSVVVVVVAWLAWPHPAEWTTKSPEALREFEAGLEARGRIYAEEARSHFEKALVLDSSFAAPLLFLAEGSPVGKDEKFKHIEAGLRRLDPRKLNQREQFLLRLQLARSTRDSESTVKVIEEFAAARPDDPFSLDLKGKLAVTRQDWTEAEAIFRRLSQVAPNWVDAYNQLGYLAMSQGRFADSERMFQTYLFVADKQANPHDSLGELLTLIGRYREAREQFEKAIEIRPDFCPSYQHLFVIASLSGELGELDRLVARVRQANVCGPKGAIEAECEATQIRAFFAGDWDRVWTSGDGPCRGTQTERSMMRFHAALRTGRTPAADAFESEWHRATDNASKVSAGYPLIQATFAHFDGTRALYAGRFGEAVTRLRAADANLSYRGADYGVFKLFNRYALTTALEHSGDAAAARGLRAEIDAVNPALLPAVARILDVVPTAPPAGH
ncbi:MAG: hypothetical protein GW878_01425 [Acidobacteria bacterium]|nr:hypothetical protein [Acidobacteriota bacterium]